MRLSKLVPSSKIKTRTIYPDTHAFAEVHALWEPPFHYLYHTYRYLSKRGEYLGVQILVNQRPFTLSIPVLNLESLEPGKMTLMDDSSPVSLANITRLSLTAQCLYSQNAKEALRIHVRSSYDGLNYDTTDLYTLIVDLQPGQLSRKTFLLESKVQYIKVMVENPDKEEMVSDVEVTVTLGG